MGTGFFYGQADGFFFLIPRMRASAFDQFACRFHRFDAAKLQALLYDLADAASLSGRGFFDPTVQIVIKCNGQSANSYLHNRSNVFDHINTNTQSRQDCCVTSQGVSVLPR